MDGVKEEVVEGDCAPWMDSGVAVKQEPAWSMEEDSSDQPSAVYSTVQPMSDNTSESLLSLKRGHVCQHCSAAFVLVSSLELHLASVHGEPLSFPEWTGSSDRLMFSQGRLYSEETDHVREYSTESTVDFVVKLEPAWSMEEDSPDQPSAVYSTVQPMSDNTSGSLLSLKRGRVCQHCSAAFVLVTSLELHLASVHGEKLHMVLPGSYGDTNRKKRSKQHVCDVCTKSFITPSKLKIHKLFHGGVKAFVCDVCSKSFPLAFQLTRHKRVHTGERPYKCPHCDKDFKESGTLQSHIKSVHDNAKPHVCDVCGAAFSLSRNLTVHKRVHTGEKPYVCSDCGKGFKQPSNLADHRLTHSGQKPHVCSDCGKGFVRPTHLAQHRLIHSGQKSHSCPHCPAAFYQSGHLKRHVQSKHQ